MARPDCDTCDGTGRIYDFDSKKGHACPDCVGGDEIPVDQ